MKARNSSTFELKETWSSILGLIRQSVATDVIRECKFLFIISHRLFFFSFIYFCLIFSYVERCMYHCV